MRTLTKEEAMARFVGNESSSGGQFLTGLAVLIVLLIVMLILLRVWHPDFAEPILKSLNLW
jgi:hypothetical protein